METTNTITFTFHHSDLLVLFAMFDIYVVAKILFGYAYLVIGKDWV